MRFTISPEQLKFFQIKHFLEIEGLLPHEDALLLLAAIAKVKEKSPGYPEINLFRSLPMIATLIKKRGWGKLVAELIHKKPLRLAYDQFFHSFPTHIEPVNEESCGLLIELKTGRGVFFRPSLPSEGFLPVKESPYLFLNITARFLTGTLHPVVA